MNILQQKIDENKVRLGRMGEICVGNWASLLGMSVLHSIDPYDRRKDLIINGRRVEVKTQVPYILEHAFSIRENQINKCRSVDELYFVALPSPNSKYIYEGSGWIYQVNSKTFLTREIITRAGHKMILIDIKQDAVVPVQQIDQSDIDQMMKYSNSI